MASHPPPKPGTLDPRAVFAREAESIVRHAMPDSTVARVPDDFALSVRGPAGEHTLFLESAFHDTRELSPEQRRDHVATLARACILSTTPSAWEDVAPRLVPVLRASSLLGSVPARAQAHGAAFLRRPFLPFLNEHLALDDDRAMQFVGAGQLAAWGVTLDAAFARASENLSRHTEALGVEAFDRDAPYPIWHVAASDSYESSRLLVPGWLASFAGHVNGRPIAVVPERAQLVVAGDADAAAVDRLLVTAEREFGASPRGISPALYTVDASSRVVPYVAPAGHPLRARTKTAHYKLAVFEYRRQKEQLEADLARANEDTFVASFVAVDGGARAEAFSYTTWGKETASLLPVVEVVAILRPDGKPMFVPWDAVREHARAWLQDEPDLNPPRVRVLGTPDGATFARLERAAKAF